MADFFIGGQWVASRAGKKRETRCPADGSLVGVVAEGTREDTEAAIAAARVAFDTAAHGRPRQRPNVATCCCAWPPS
jgi:betaine-aldehyde dehydrogenase